MRSSRRHNQYVEKKTIVFDFEFQRREINNVIVVLYMLHFTKKFLFRSMKETWLNFVFNVFFFHYVTKKLHHPKLKLNNNYRDNKYNIYGLYKLQAYKIVVETNFLESFIYVHFWHKKKDHLNFHILHLLPNHVVVKGVSKLQLIKYLCEGWFMGGQTYGLIFESYFKYGNKGIRTSTFRHVDCFQFLHFLIPSIFFTFINDFNKMSWVFFLKIKL
jgi:hypothetical protein